MISIPTDESNLYVFLLFAPLLLLTTRTHSIKSHRIVFKHSSIIHIQDFHLQTNSKNSRRKKKHPAVKLLCTAINFININKFSRRAKIYGCNKTMVKDKAPHGGW